MASASLPASTARALSGCPMTATRSEPELNFSPWVRWRDRSRLTTNEPTMAVYLWARFESLPPSIVPDAKNLSPELIYVGETNELKARLLRDQRHQRLLVYRATFPDDPDVDLLFVSVAAVAPFRPQERNCPTETEHGKASADPLVVTMRRTGPRWQLTSDTKTSWRQCSPSINGRIVNVETDRGARCRRRRRAASRQGIDVDSCTLRDRSQPAFRSCLG
jgi:hypothetical protein